jgi:hypothetical protein
VLVLVAAAAFGVGAAALHGASGGTRAAIGNLSVPWLLVGFLGGAHAGRGSGLRGLVVGTVATVVALLGFYAANVYVLKLEPDQPLPQRLVFAIQSGTYYIKFGFLCGPVVGWFGATWWRTRRVSILMAFAVLAMLEPVAWEIYFESAPGGTSQFSANAAAWIPEFVIGLGALVWIAARRRRRGMPRTEPRP